MARTYVFRLTSEGVRELEAQFKSAGDAGERLFENLKTKVPGLGGVLDQQNRKVDETRRRLEEAAQSSNAFTGALDRTGQSIGSLIGRYTRWAVIITAVTRGIRSAAESNDELAQATDDLSQSWNRMWANAAPLITPVVDLTADVLENVNEIFDALSKKDWRGAWQKFAEATSVEATPELTERMRQIGVIPEAGVTGRTGGIIGNVGPQPFGTLKQALEYGDQLLAEDRKRTADRIQNDQEVQQKALDEALAYGEQLLAQDRERTAKRIEQENEVQDKALKEALEYGEALLEQDRKRTAQRIKDEEEVQDKALKEALEYGEQLLAQDRETRAKRIADQTEELERQKREAEYYWRGVTEDLRFTFKDAWMEITDTGELNFENLFRRIKSIWSSTLYDMIIEAQLKPIIVNVVSQLGGLAGLGGGGGGLLSGILGGGGISWAGLPGVAGGTWNGIPMSVPVTAPAGSFWGAGGFGGQYLGPALGGAFTGLGIGSLTGMIGGNQTGGAIGGALGGAIGSIIPGVGTLLGSAIGGLAGGLIGGKPSDYRSVATFGAGMSGFNVAAQSAHETNAQTMSLAQQAAQAIMAEVQQLQAFGIEFKQQLSNLWIGSRDPSTFQLAGGQRISAGTVGDTGDLVGDVLTALLKGATSSNPQIAAMLSRGAGLDQIGQAVQFSSSVDALLASLDYGQLSVKPPAQQYAAALSAFNSSRDRALSGGPAEASAFLSDASSFLPAARNYLGISEEYGALETSVRNLAEQLRDSAFGAPMDLAAPIVEAQSKTTAVLERIEEELKRQNGVIDVLKRRVFGF